MPADSITTERYVVYSTDGSNEDDTRSIKSEQSDSLTYRDPAFIDIQLVKTSNRTREHALTSPTSPVPSSITTDKWGSYWTKRERCCCFWNFLLTVTVAVLITIVVLATKGMMTLNPGDASGANGSGDALIGTGTTPITTAAICTTPQPVEPEVCTSTTCTRVSADILRYMNITEDPCNDFYAYACGGFLETVHLSWNTPRKRMNPEIVQHKYIETLAESLSEEIHQDDSTEEMALKKLFQSCVKTPGTTLDQVKGVMDMLGGFEYGASLKTKELDLTQLTTVSLLNYGVSPLFDMTITKDGRIGLYNRFSDTLLQTLRGSGLRLQRYRFLQPSDYIYRDENNDQLLLAYKEYMGNFIAHVIGVNATERADQRFVAMVNDIYHLNIYMNRVLYTEEVLNPVDEMSHCDTPVLVENIERQYSYNITWKVLLASLFNQSSFSHNYTVCFTSLTNAINDVISGFPYITIKRYLIFYTLTQSELFYLLPSDVPRFTSSQQMKSSALIDEDSAVPDYFCARQISRHLPMHYVIANHIFGHFNDALQSLFIALIASIEDIIRDLYWMPITQKQHLLTELTGLSVQLEWQVVNDSFREYITNITDNYFTNTLLMIRYQSGQFLRGRGQQAVTDMHYTVVSMQDKVLVAIPLSAVHLPFMYAQGVASVWYGSVGTALSQTISELFDIDALLRMLTDDRLDHRVALTLAFRLQCLLNEYGKYPTMEKDGQTYYVKGDLTKSANFKDSLALRVAYNAYMEKKPLQPDIPTLPFTDDQLFFISYAQTMCEKVSDKGIYKYYINTDISHHSPGKYRVLGTLAHFKKFAETFQCSDNSVMNPLNKCTMF